MFAASVPLVTIRPAFAVTCLSNPCPTGQGRGLTGPMHTGGLNVAEQASSKGYWARLFDRWRKWRHDVERRQQLPALVGPLGVHLLGVVLALVGLGLIV